MTTVSAIIARAGSKGLKNKSLQKVGGKALVAWTIEHALSSKRVDEVTLSSDCPHILTVGKAYDIHCYKRPPELATDTATIDSGARHGVESWEQTSGKQADYVAIHYANIPLRPANLTDRAIQKLIETEADSVQSVSPVGKMHPYWMKTLDGPFEDKLCMYQENRVYRRQDLPPVYMLDAGVLAVTRRSLFSIDPAEPHAFLGEDRRAIVSPAGSVVDVDDAVDLAVADALMRMREQAA